MRTLVSLTEAASLLNDGKVGVIPTDTVYGLVAKAADQRAVDQLYGLKNRESKPGTIIAASVDQLVELGIPRRYLKAVEQYWPSPLSVVVPTGMELAYLHLGKQSLAVRIPADQDLLSLLANSGPLLTSSANEPGKPTATTAQAAEQYFHNRVDFYVEGGDLSSREPSTIIRVVDDAIEVLREGAVKIDERGIIS